MVLCDVAGVVLEERRERSTEGFGVPGETVHLFVWRTYYGRTSIHKAKKN